MRATTPTLVFAAALTLCPARSAWAQVPVKKPAPATPAAKPAAPVPAPTAPQSKHYPILIVAHGNDPSWSLRIGMKGPERLDRSGYPPIVLEPSEVAREGTAEAWTYSSKDTATGAGVAVHLSRESCSDAASAPAAATSGAATPPAPPSTPAEKYSFRVVVAHTQIGSLTGCGRSSPDLFPEFKAKNVDKDDQDKPPDDTKKKTVLDPITKFKMPAAVAYLNTAQQVVFKRGQVSRMVSARPSSGLSVSHDGNKLLFTADDAPGPIRTLIQYDFNLSAKHELVRANVREPFWSPSDKRIAFLKWDNSAWSLWTASTDNPQASSNLFTVNGIELYGWADESTLLVSDNENLVWISDDGSIRQKLPFQEVFGSGYRMSRVVSFRLNPANPDLVLASFFYVPPAGEAPLDRHEGDSPAVILYEFKSKRRVKMTPPGTWAESAEWSRDGLQIFFTGCDSSHQCSTYRMFWDASGLVKYSSGSNLVIGQ